MLTEISKSSNMYGSIPGGASAGAFGGNTPAFGAGSSASTGFSFGTASGFGSATSGVQSAASGNTSCTSTNLTHAERCQQMATSNPSSTPFVIECRQTNSELYPSSLAIFSATDAQDRDFKVTLLGQQVGSLLRLHLCVLHAVSGFGGAFSGLSNPSSTGSSLFGSAAGSTAPSAFSFGTGAEHLL